jgi:hypothetical protein
MMVFGIYYSRLFCWLLLSYGDLRIIVKGNRNLIFISVCLKCFYCTNRFVFTPLLDHDDEEGLIQDDNQENEVFGMFWHVLCLKFLINKTYLSIKYRFNKNEN